MTAGTIVIGLLNGLTTGLLAVGLVLIYKSNRFINLAQAQLGTLSALLLEKWVLDWGWNWWVACVLAVAVGIATGIVVQTLFIRTLAKRTKSTVSMLLMTIGVSQILLALTYFPALTPSTATTDTEQYPQAFVSNVHLFGVQLTASSLLILILAPVLVASLGSMLHFSVLGKKVRAVASNQDEAARCGISVNRVQALTWGLAGGLAAISALLAAPSQGSLIGSSLGPSLLVAALGAAACGAFVSIPAALIGAIFLSVVSQIVAAETNNGGDAQLALLVLILLVILVRGKAIAAVFNSSGLVGISNRPLRVPESLKDRWILKHRTAGLGTVGIAVGVLLPLLPFFSSDGNRFLLVLVLVYALVAVSLTILVGWAGQVSLGHFALVGVGAYMVVRLGPHNWTVLGMTLFAGVIGAVVMVIVGVPALRIRGLALAVSSLALAVVAPTWLYGQSWFGQATDFGNQVNPILLGRGLGTPESELSIYMVALGLLILVMLAAASLRRSVPGRLVMAVRDNERATAAFGINPSAVKLAALATSGFIAATAGVIWADAWHVVSTDQFGPELSIAIIALPVLGGLGSLGGAVGATCLIYLPTFFLAPHLSGIFGDGTLGIGFALSVAGIGLIGTLLANPGGIAGSAQDGFEAILLLADRRRTKTTNSEQYLTTGPASSAVAPATRTSRPLLPAGWDNSAQSSCLVPDTHPPLEVADISVSFGGVKALDGATIRVDVGEVVGLIGPNGAGMTTPLTAVWGLTHPTDGSVKLFGHEAVDLPATRRAHFGVARSFQDATLFAGLTVKETVQVALSYRRPVGFLSSMLRLPWARLTESDSSLDADAILIGLGLERSADVLTSELSTGTRRICDLAAQIASRPKLLLLDEPTAGIAQREAENFGPLLNRLRTELQCSVLIIEHDMPLLMGVCDRIYALEAGRVIASGTPVEVRNDRLVVASYLGTRETAISRSGPGSPDGEDFSADHGTPARARVTTACTTDTDMSGTDERGT
jgi:ABC-type branched-subunit amino acid transport system ATPase component/ABC-type branched-subunit amino acid transport system permease subunit